jgi:hypothetical protein
VTPFGAARANDRTTAARFHAHQETMRSFAPYDRRLEGPFHSLLRNFKAEILNPAL